MFPNIDFHSFACLLHSATPYNRYSLYISKTKSFDKPLPHSPPPPPPHHHPTDAGVGSHRLITFRDLDLRRNKCDVAAPTPPSERTSPASGRNTLRAARVRRVLHARLSSSFIHSLNFFGIAFYISILFSPSSPRLAFFFLLFFLYIYILTRRG